jgi:hypothetical protein
MFGWDSITIRKKIKSPEISMMANNPRNIKDYVIEKSKESQTCS